MIFPLVQDRSVLITGCSSGIGRAAARCLRDAGWKVWATARTAEALDALEAEGLIAVPLDLARAGNVEEAACAVLEQSAGRLGAIVNNAGYGQPGALEDLSRETMRRQFEVNVIGLQHLTNQFIPVFRRQGWGRIVNVSSVVGVVSLPFFGVYSASKFALEALSDALRVELRSSGIAVSLVEPGPIATAFGRRAAREARETLLREDSPFAELYEEVLIRRKIEQREENQLFMRPPEDVAKKIRHALESRRPAIRYPVTWPARAGLILKRLAPAGLIDYLMWKRWSRRVSHE